MTSAFSPSRAPSPSPSASHREAARCRRYSSPPPPQPPEAGLCRGKSCYSPPPPPRPFARCCVDDVGEPAADSVFIEINSGRSILNSKPMDLSGDCLPRKAPREEFEGGFENSRSVRSRINRGLMSPCSHSFPSLAAPAGRIWDHEDNEEADPDMPSFPTSHPITLAMRTSTRSQPRTIVHRVPGGLLQHQFIPIQPHDDNDEDCERKNSGRSFLAQG